MEELTGKRIQQSPQFGLRDALLTITVSIMYFGTFVGLLRASAAADRAEHLFLTGIFIVLALVLLAYGGKTAARSVGERPFVISSSIPWKPLLLLAIAVTGGGHLATYFPRFIDGFVLFLACLGTVSMRLIFRARMVVGRRGIVLPFYGYRSWDDIDLTIHERSFGAYLLVRFDGCKRGLKGRLPMKHSSELLSNLSEAGIRRRTGQGTGKASGLGNRGHSGSVEN